MSIGNVTIPKSDSESDVEKVEASENLFTENTDNIAFKKIKLFITDDDLSTHCGSPHSQVLELHEQNAQTWSDEELDIQSEMPRLQKQFKDASVMTTLPFSIEIDENTRISNLMFCKFIAHELDKYEGNDRFDLMQKILEVLKRKK
ncbi:hypothetical protein evm_010243 [Chilo suppressalis]|nr:hypothetical protein evm_010243 [Chilo suppressalis]